MLVKLGAVKVVDGGEGSGRGAEKEKVLRVDGGRKLEQVENGFPEGGAFQVVGHGVNFAEAKDARESFVGGVVGGDPAVGPGLEGYKDHVQGS